MKLQMSVPRVLLIVTLTVIYLLATLYFFKSYFVSSPNAHVLGTPGYVKDLRSSAGDYADCVLAKDPDMSGCLHSCGNMGVAMGGMNSQNYKPYVQKGFPFATNDYYSYCPVGSTFYNPQYFPAKDFTVAAVLDWVIWIAATLLWLVLIHVLIKSQANRRASLRK